MSSRNIDPRWSIKPGLRNEGLGLFGGGTPQYYFPDEYPEPCPSHLGHFCRLPLYQFPTRGPTYEPCLLPSREGAWQAAARD